MPPTPRAASKLMLPVEITEMGINASRDPRRTMEPLPNCFSICARASSTALVRSSAMAMRVLLLLRSPRALPNEEGEKRETWSAFRWDCSRMGQLIDTKKRIKRESGYWLCDGQYMVWL